MIAIILAGASSMLVSLFGTRYLIAFFRQRGQGQPILGKARVAWPTVAGGFPFGVVIGGISVVIGSVSAPL